MAASQKDKEYVFPAVASNSGLNRAPSAQFADRIGNRLRVSVCLLFDVTIISR